MRRAMFGALALALLPMGCETTGVPGGFGTILGDVMGSPTAQGALSQAEIDAGLREALTVSTNLVAAQLGKTDGYFGDPRIRIPLPKTYRDIQTNLARVGASGPLDDLELRMNRAAEAAVPDARALILGAVRSITINDALQILNGGDTAATDYLRARTETQLRASFTPYVRQSLERSPSQYGLGGVTSNLQGDLTNHAVGLGLDGIFLYVADEEKKIRENPVARTSEILRRVFGNRA